ncbi:MAG: hypothetical protein ACOVMQ_01185, partial [Cyclobacteriaceae bacterium]
LINKKPNEKGGKVFLRGMWQGAIGGVLVFSSKKMVYEFAQTENYAWLWSSKLVNAAGVSISENAGANQKFLSTWHFNFGFNRIELNFNKSIKLNYKIMPFALGSFIYASTKGSFDLEQTIKVGQPFFWTKEISWPDGGFAIANSVVLNKILYNDSQSIAHEIIHTYQYQGDVGFNNYYMKQFNQILKKNNSFTKLYKKWIYTDFNFLVSGGLYYLGSLNNKCYFDNPFEQEANYYSERLSCSDL